MNFIVSQAVEESKAAQIELQERLSQEEQKSLAAESKLQETNTVSQRLETQKIEVMSQNSYNSTQLS